MRNGHFKSLLKDLAGFFLRYSGLSLAVRNTIARDKVAILVYHNPTPEDMERHLSYLSKRYNFITLDRLVEAIYSQDWSEIPPKSVVITVDDGHKDNYHLLEVFKKYKVIPTIFLTTQIVSTNRRFWWNVAGTEREGLKKCANDERLNFLRTHYGFTQTDESPTGKRDALNLEEIAAMKDYVDFQSHSRFHPVLTNCTSKECELEVALSKVELEKLAGKSCRYFCYPGGHYSKREIELVKKAGYLAARSIDIGWNDLRTDPYRLKRIGMDDDSTINYLAAQMTGLIDLFKVKALKIAGPGAIWTQARFVWQQMIP